MAPVQLNPPRHQLMLQRLSMGGYVVAEIYGGNGMMSPQLFACTTIEEALKFIKKEMDK
jgi:hypothetical protein